MALVAAAACAPYSAHHPARLLGAGEHQLALTVDVAKFLPRGPSEGRPPEVLDDTLLLPTLHYRRGLSGQFELDLSMFPVGLRAGLRTKLVGRPGETGWAASAEAGASLVGILAPGETTANFKPLIVPDAGVSAGWAHDQDGEAYLGLRWIWLREKIAGAGFEHALGATLGYARDLGPVGFDAGGTAWVSPSSRDLLVAPGIGLTVGDGP